jgi:hypothetical protein
MDETLLALHRRWRQKAELFRQHGHEATARAYELCSTELEAVLRQGQDQLLDLQEAARESGYSPDHLGRLLRSGTIPNSGRRNAPRIRRGDLPRRPEVAARHQTESEIATRPTGSSRARDISFERIAREALVSKRR